MTRTYLILKTTDKISSAINSESFNDADQALVELRDDLREYPVDDEAYEEVLSEVNSLVENNIIEEINSEIEVADSAVDAFKIDITNSINRAESLYLRNSDTSTNHGKSIKQTRRERDFYQNKLNEYHQIVMERTDNISTRDDDQEGDIDDIEKLTKELTYKITNISSAENKLEEKDNMMKELKELYVTHMMEAAESFEEIARRDNKRKNKLERLIKDLKKLGDNLEEVEPVDFESETDKQIKKELEDLRRVSGLTKSNSSDSEQK